MDNFAISEDGSDWTVASATALTASSEKALFYDVDTRSFSMLLQSGDSEKPCARIRMRLETTFTTPASYSSEQLSYPRRSTAPKLAQLQERLLALRLIPILRTSMAISILILQILSPLTVMEHWETTIDF